MSSKGQSHWRLELTASKDCIELSFQDVCLRSASDVARWVAELELALQSFRRPADMLLDLRGLYVAPECGEACCRALGDLLDRHALGISYYGGSRNTRDVLDPCLAARSGHPEVMRSRSPALAHLIQLRRRREGLRPMPHMPYHFLAGDNGWDESGAAFI